MKELFWLNRSRDAWLDRLEQGRVPHAVLLAGSPGLGKRAFAAWIVNRQLGLDSLQSGPLYPFERPEHADLNWLSTPEGKQGIGIDQVRGLVGDLALTSYEGRGKVAVIEPANAMNINAANSLLKTLEEPPGNTLLVLIADRVGRLPATIFSRCQRIDVTAPNEADALAWLDQVRPGTQWSEALALAGNAPLGAIAALEHIDIHASLARDFAALGQGRGSAIEIAARWADYDPAFVFEWLARQVESVARGQVGATERRALAAIDDSVLKRMDRRNLFCYLDIINRLRGQPTGSYNVQLALEGLLIDLAEGLTQVTGRPPGTDQPVFLWQR
ncbi:MAG: hypothetical protein AAF351_07025 [Pseudomonadota bacterium]